jgi:membrane-associated protease RseP (regulator of RpoE activity)
MDRRRTPDYSFGQASGALAGSSIDSRYGNMKRPIQSWLVKALLAVAFVAAPQAHAGVNDAPTSGPPAPFAGTFKDERLTVVLERDESLPGPSYKGTISLGGTDYPATAQVKDGKLDGSFRDKAGNTFPFSAKLDGGTLLLTSGSATYKLSAQAKAKPSAPANPLDTGAPAQAPAAATPATTPPPAQPPAQRNAGIGIHIKITSDGAILVDDLVPTGPAARAGVQKDDRLVAIDGDAVRGPEDLAAKLPGVAGSSVKVTFARGGANRDFNLTREVTTGTPPPQPTAISGGGSGLGGVLGGTGSAPTQPPANRQADIGGQRGQYTVNTSTPVLNLYPELKTAQAPTWVKPSLRLTWYSAAASIPGGRIGALVEDEHGQWQDPGGKSFRTEDAASASGHGYSQLDVAALHDDVAAVEFKMLMIDGVQGPVRLATSNGALTTPGACGDWWVNPIVLNKQMEALGNGGPGVRVVRTPYQAGGRTYNAVWTNTKTDNGSISYVVDTDTGLVLHIGTAAYSASSPVSFNGVSQNVGGRTDLGQTTFLGMRQLQVPWSGADLPQSIANVRRLRYEGTYTTTVPSAGSISWPYAVNVNVTGRGRDFLQLQKATTIQYGNGAPPQESTADGVSGSGQFTPLAIPPEHLARLRQGQELDRDPITKIALVVNFIGRDQRGNDIVALTETAGQGTQRTDYVYERASGLLLSMSVTDPGVAATIQVQVSLRGKE